MAAAYHASILTILLFLTGSVWAAELPRGSYDLHKIIKDEKTPPFACMFGNFKVKIKSRNADGISVVLAGEGILINSGWLTTPVNSNPEITHVFPVDAAIKDGSVLSLFCNDTGKPGDAKVAYFVNQYER